MISIGVHRIAYDKHSCAMPWNYMAFDEIKLLMISIVVQFIDKHSCALHCL